MHCLAGAGHALASATSAFGGEKVFDSTAFVSEAFFATRLNAIEQTFARRLAAIDFKVERQHLHREDIRDLIELTARRMDIYILVGTLLLAFVMEWYTDSGLWKLPVWYSDLFIISNYSALGYLVMVVWLSMFASIASKSIGTRLLTSYARLALPTKGQLKTIKNPVFFNATSVKEFLKSKLGCSKEMPDVEASVDQDEDALTYVESEDHTQHFRVFLEELPRWIVYDTWARICMSFGMNQLLQALSYFVLATIWEKYPLGGIMSFLAVNMLGVLVLWLDVGDRDQSTEDILALVFLKSMPAFFAVAMLLAQSLFPSIMEGERYFESVLVVACFCAHAGWLWYLWLLFSKNVDQNGRFQPSAFANVLEWVPLNHTLQSFTMGSSGCLSNAGAAQDQDDARPNEVNGGLLPGTWMESSRDVAQDNVVDMSSTEHLPVRMLVLFTRVTVVWWILAGVTHSLLIAFDQHNKLKDFTGSNDMAPLTAQSVYWPEPAGLFKVDGLYCSDSHMWVASGFSIYEMIASQAAQSTPELSFVKDGSVASAICGANYCSSLSQPEVGGPWVMSSLPPSHGADAMIPIPKAWRKVTGAWTTCSEAQDSACTSGWLAGWDGTRILAATLTKSSADMNSWHVDPRFEADPSIGLCAGALTKCSHGPQKYDHVRALHMSSCGRLLLVLLDEGILDFWDLSKGVVVRRVHVGDPSYTAMCQSGGHVYLSREDGAKPLLMTMSLPSILSELMKHPRPLQLAFHPTVTHAPNRFLAAEGVGRRLRPARHRLALATRGVREHVSMASLANRTEQNSWKRHPVTRLRFSQHAKLKT